MQDKEVVREIYERHKAALYRLCYFHTGNGQDAADAVQNTLIKLMEHEGSFNSLYHEKCWIMKVAVNECRRILRHWWRDTLPYEEVLEYEAQQQIYREDEVLSEIMELPAKYRIPLYMHYYEGYSLVELGSLLGINESTLRSRLMRGRKLLKMAITDEPERKHLASAEKQSAWQKKEELYEERRV